MCRGARVDQTQPDHRSRRAQLAADLATKYANGASIRALAESIGRSYGFVHQVLAESGVVRRSRGGATRATTKQTP